MAELAREKSPFPEGPVSATHAEKLADFVVRASFDSLSKNAIKQLKIRILDSLGCAIGAVEGEPVCIIREQIEDFQSAGKCGMIGGEETALDHASFHNGALIRYLDFNDGYLAKYETCHPSDNLAAVLAAAEYAGCSGRDFVTALAVAYQVQCRLSDVAPVRTAGFDHTAQGSLYSRSGPSGRQCNARAVFAGKN
jgi:2-methylcitrate dehydratase